MRKHDAMTSTGDVNRFSYLLAVLCFGISGCRSPDRSPQETVKECEDDIGHARVAQARSLLTTQQAKDANTLFMGVMAEEHNRIREGIVSERRSTETTAESSRVVAVYEMRDGLRRTYTWELMREEGRWRINGWEAEVSGGLR